MDVRSKCPLPAGGYAWRPPFGGHAFVVIVKATFELEPGIAKLARVQDDLNDADNHWNDDPKCSVYAPSDMAPYKERVDVTLVGDAHAPLPSGARSLSTRLSVGSLDKRVVVQCDRWLDEHGKLREGGAFRRMPLRYERAAASNDNPVGLAVAPPRLGARRPLPNLQPGGARLKGRTVLAGFGPLAARWPSRQRRLGAAAELFQGTSWRSEALAADLGVYFNDAPPDQQLEALPSDASIALENLHPRVAKLQSKLPGIEPRAFIERCGTVAEVALTADSLWIDMTRGVCTVTWRGSFEIASPSDAGRVHVGMQSAGEELDVDELLGPERSLSGPDRTSSVRLMSQPPSSSSAEILARPRARAHTLDLAAGAEHEAVLPFVMPSRSDDYDCMARTSALPTLLSPPPPCSTPGGSSPPPPMTERASSPWAAGALTASRTRFVPPPSPIDRDSVVPPPLLMVPPPPSSASQERHEADAQLRGPLDAQHRLEVLGYDEDRYDRVTARWPERDEEDDDALTSELRAVFDTAEPRKPSAARRHLDRVMTEQEATSFEALRRMTGQAGEPPLALCHGSLSFPFDEVETLKATIAAVSPYLRKNDPLREEVEAARELLKDPSLSGCPEVAEELLERIRAAYRDDAAVDNDAIETRTERMLLGRRAYQRRSLLGAKWVRALLTVDGLAVPCYLPESLAASAPLFSKLTVRVIAELYPRQDQYESASMALSAMAFGRIIPCDQAVPA